MSEPERTCLVTGKKFPFSQLDRFTIVDGRLVFDSKTKNSGRGGYLVKDPAVRDKLPKMLGKVRHFMKVKGELRLDD